MNQTCRHVTITRARPESVAHDSGQGGAGLSRSTAVEAICNDITQTLHISFVPDLFKTMSNRPAYLATAWELFKDQMNLNHLDHRTKRIVALAITTNEAGAYFITALPQAFRLGALDEATFEKVLSTTRLFLAFDQYLSGITTTLATDCPSVGSHDVHENHGDDETARLQQCSASREECRKDASWLGGLIVVITVLSWAVGLYWFI